MPSDQGLRYNEGKPPVSQMPYEALVEYAKVCKAGYEIKGYPKFNWKKGLIWTETADSAIRHLFKWLNGEEIDPETGVKHISCFMWNAVALVYMVITGKGTDDREIRIREAEALQSAKLPESSVPTPVE